jgi:hypothetical protein
MVLFGQEKMKLFNNWKFVVNKAEIMRHILKCINFPFYLIKYTKFLGEYYYAYLKFIPSETSKLLHAADRLQPGRSCYSSEFPPKDKKTLSEIKINLIHKRTDFSCCDTESKVLISQ